MARVTNRQLSPLAWLGIALVVGIALLAIFGALAFSTWGRPYADGSYGMMGGGNWGWAALLMGIPAVILIIILVVVLVGIRDAGPVTVASPPLTALETLNVRYARNELSREEYLRIRSDLTGTPGGRE